MDIEEAIAVVDTILGAHALNDLQEQIFRQVWAGEKYPDIAEALGYDANYIKDSGAKIWKQLAQALGEKVTKSNIQSVLRRQRLAGEWQTQTAVADSGTPGQGNTKRSSGKHIIRDWNERANTSAFIGRDQTLVMLSDWILLDHCRLIGLVGMAGLGKTIFAARLTEQVAEDFDVIIWRSLQHSPPLTQLLQDILKSLPPDLTLADLEDSLEAQLSLLIQYLKERRCLVVLDHTDTLIEPSSITRDYRSGYEEYHTLFQAVGSTHHQSCVLVTGREALTGWSFLENANHSVRSLPLSPITPEETQALLQKKGQFEAIPKDWQSLTEQYGGNPLALQIVSTTVLDVFQGDVSEFLAEGQIVFEGLSAFLQQQWEQLSTGEQWVLYYLAVRRENVSFKDLKADLLDSSLRRRLTEILSGLERRSLLERQTDDGIVFNLQTAVLEYVSFRLVETLKTELVQSKLNILHQCPLLKVNSQDYIQQEQRQALLQTLLESLQEWRPNDVRQHLEELLRQLKNSAPSYAAGNIVNLLIQLKAPLAFDLSHLALWEVNFASVPLHQVNLSHCDLARTEFSNAFSGVTSVALSPLGDHFVTGHENGALFIWDIQGGRQLQHLSGHRSWVWELCWSPNGQSIISASEDQTLRIWDANTGDCQKILAGHQDRIWSVICPNDEIAVSASSDQTVKVWHLPSGQCLQTLTGHEGDVTALAVGRSKSECFSGGGDKTLRLWDLETGEQLDIWTSNQERIWAIAYSTSTQTLYSAGDDGVIEAWQSGNAHPVKVLGRRNSRIWSMSLSPSDRYLVTVGDSGRLECWDLQSDRLVQSLADGNERIWSVDYDASGSRVITASADNTVRLWNLDKGQPLLTLTSYSNWACEVGMIAAPNKASTKAHARLIASAYGDGNLYLWGVEDGELKQTLQGHQRSVWTLAINPLSTHLVSGSDDCTLRVWDIHSGHCQFILRGHRSKVWSAAWSPKGNIIASGSGDRTIKLWDTESGTCLNTLEKHQDRVWTVAFSPTHPWLASGSSDRTIRLWNPNTGDCLATLEGHQSLILSVAFHPTQPLLASVGGDGTCKLWDLTTYTCQSTIMVPVKMLWAIAWSPDGQYLAIGGDDGQVRCWDTQDQTWIPPLIGHTGCIWSIAFSPDTQHLVSGSQDGTTRYWEVESGLCKQVLQPQRLYEELNIMDTTGLNTAQIQTLITLGAKA